MDQDRVTWKVFVDKRRAGDNLKQGAYMLLISLLLTFSGISHAAKLDKEFSCYSAMNRKTRAANVVMAGKIAIHPIDDNSFFTVSENGIQKCTLPKDKTIAPDADPKKGPWLVEVTVNKQAYPIQYPQVQSFSEGDGDGITGGGRFRPAKCAASSDKATIVKILENRIADSRQACGEGPKFGECLSEFLGRLRQCLDIPAVSAYVNQVGQAADLHAKHPPGGGYHSDPQTHR